VLADELVKDADMPKGNVRAPNRLVEEKVAASCGHHERHERLGRHL